MSVSSNYMYIQKRGYGIECRLLRVKIRNTSVFMGLAQNSAGWKVIDKLSVILILRLKFIVLMKNEI